MFGSAVRSVRRLMTTPAAGENGKDNHNNHNHNHNGTPDTEAESPVPGDRSPLDIAPSTTSTRRRLDASLGTPSRPVAWSEKEEGTGTGTGTRTILVAERAKNGNGNGNGNPATLSIPALYQLIDAEIRVNIGASVKCGICLSTIQTPTRTPCGHAFCKSCILASLHCSSKCPECQGSITKRSLQPHAHLHALSKLYKTALQEFALIPGQYQAGFTTLTQAPLIIINGGGGGGGGGGCGDLEEDDLDEETVTQRHVDRLHLATTWQSKALPVLQPSTIQMDENRQVVAANRAACEQAGFEVETETERSAINVTGRVNVTGKAKKTETKVKTNLDVDLNLNVNVTCMPTTQEVQDEERAQQAADFELQEQTGLLDEEQAAKGEADSAPLATAESQVFGTPAAIATSQDLLMLDQDQHDQEEEEMSKEMSKEKPTVHQISTTHQVADEEELVERHRSHMSSDSQSSAASRRVTFQGTATPTGAPPVVEATTNNEASVSPAVTAATTTTTTPVTQTASSAAKQASTSSSPFAVDALSPISFQASQGRHGQSTSENIDHGSRVSRRTTTAAASPGLPPTSPQPPPQNDKEDEDELDFWKNHASTETTTEELKDDNNTDHKGPNMTGLVEDSFGALHWQAVDATIGASLSFDDEGLSLSLTAFTTTQGEGGATTATAAAASDYGAYSKGRSAGKAETVDRAPASTTKNDDNDDDDDAVSDDDSDQTIPMSAADDADAEDEPATLTINSADKRDKSNQEENAAASSTMTLGMTSPSTAPSTRRSSRGRGATPLVVPARRRSTTGGITTTTKEKTRSTRRRPASEPNRPTTTITAAANTPTPASRSFTSSSSCLVVGNIVTVQARTWSGINKPGGVARIRTINIDGTMNVSYVLGGRENQVDAVFVSRQEGDDEAGPQRRRREIATEAALPPDLLQELVKQGFDTTVSFAQAQAASKKRDDLAGGADIQTEESLGSDALKEGGGKKRSRSTTATKKGVTTKLGKKRKSAESTSAEKRQDTEDSSATATRTTRKRKSEESTTSSTTSGGQRKTPMRRSDASGVSTLPKAIKKKKTKSVNIPLFPAVTDAEACGTADDRYQKLLEAAMKKKVIHVIASNLSEADMDILKALSTKSLADDVRLRLSDSFGKKTTICVMPIDIDSDGHSTTRLRTAKAMRAALAGIPIVSPAWLKLCGEANAIVVPTSEMVARSIPTKTPAVESSGDVKYGVAKVAAYHVEKSPLPLHAHSLFLCGAFSESKRKDLHLLAKEAGARVLSSPSAVSGKLGKTKVVLVCQDTATGGMGIPVSVVNEVQSFLESDPASVQIVNSQWLFDSIACARPMPADVFPPADPKAKELAVLSQFKVS